MCLHHQQKETKKTTTARKKTTARQILEREAKRLDAFAARSSSQRQWKEGEALVSEEETPREEQTASGD